MQDDEWGFHIPGVRNRRIARVSFPVLPWPARKAALAALEDLAVSHTAVFVDQSIHADHVSERRAGDCGREHVGLRDDKGRLISTPGVSVNPDLPLIDEPSSTGFFYVRNTAAHCRH